MKASSSIVPSAHQPALFLIQDGISLLELVPCVVDGIFKIFSLTRN